MNEKRQERVESAIIYMVSQFPGLLGPIAIQAGVKAVFHIPDAECAPIEDKLAFLESLDMLIRRDSGRGYPVFYLTARALSVLPRRPPRIQLKTPAGRHDVGRPVETVVR